MYSFHCLLAFGSWSTLILHVSFLPVNLFSSDFCIIFSFLALSLAQLPLTFLCVMYLFSLFSCSAVCEMHWTVELPRSIKQWGRDESIELQECTLSFVCCHRQDWFPVVQLYLCCISFRTNYDICCSFIFAFLSIQSNSIWEKYSFWTCFSPVGQPQKRKAVNLNSLNSNFASKSSITPFNCLCILKFDFGQMYALLLVCW